MAGRPRRSLRLQTQVLLRGVATVLVLAAAYLLAYEVRFEFQVPRPSAPRP